ncbi:MAG: glycosyltransferase family 39 protein [Planctomycetota bacterium]
MHEALAAVATYLIVLAAGDLCCVVLDIAVRHLTSWLGLRFLCGSGVVAVLMLALHFLGVGFGLRSVCGVILIAWLAARLIGRARIARQPQLQWDWSDALLLPVFGLALGHGLAEPIYTSDPMNIYGQNARVFEVHGSLAPEALKALVDPGHIDYPPLVALDEALLFLAAPGMRERVVKPMFALFLLAFLVLARDVIRMRLRPAAALLLIAALAFTPELRHYGARGFADLPLAAFLMAFVVLASDALERRRVLAALAAGSLLGFGALTKNEGFAVAVLAAPVLALVAVARRWRVAVVAAIVIPALGLGLAWYAFRQAHGIDSDLFQSFDARTALANLARVPRILTEFARVPLRRNNQQLLMWGAFWFGWVVTIALGLVSRLADRRALLAWGSVWLAHLALYLGIYVITPRNLEWHLVTSAQRLVLHLLPWTVMVWVAALERVAGTSERIGAASR